MEAWRLLMKMMFPLKFSRKFDFFVLTRKIGESDFFTIFTNSRWSRNSSNWITYDQDIIYLRARASKVFLSRIFFVASRELHSCFRLVPCRLSQDSTSNVRNQWKNEKLPIFRRCRSQMFFKEGVFQNFAKSIEKHICRSTFLIYYYYYFVIYSRTKA